MNVVLGSNSDRISMVSIILPSSPTGRRKEEEKEYEKMKRGNSDYDAFP